MSTKQHTPTKNPPGNEYDRTVGQVQDISTQKSPELTTDDIYHLLQNERRRLVLKYLQGTSDPVRMRDIAEQVAAWEHDTTVRELNSKQRQRVYIPLYQSHLPKLDQAGIITYQQSRGIVERTPKADLLDPYLDATEEEQPAPLKDNADVQEDYSFGIAIVGTVMVVGAFLELPLISSLSGIVIATILLVLVSLYSISRYVDVRNYHFSLIHG